MESLFVRPLVLEVCNKSCQENLILVRTGLNDLVLHEAQIEL
jgi:hypothetical protein